MKPIPKDYKAPESAYSTCKPGKYTATGFTWFSLDQAQRPILIAQRGSLVARGHFEVEEKAEGKPSFSYSLSEVALLVKALGGEEALKKLPPLPMVTNPGAVTEYLVAAAALGRGRREIVVGDKGWVQSVEGMDPGQGLYYYRLVKIEPRNAQGLPEPKKGRPFDPSKPDDFKYFFYVHLEIVAGEGGTVTPYKGVVLSEPMNYGCVVVDNDGTREPDFAKRADGGYTPDAYNQGKLMFATAPKLFEDGYRYTYPDNVLPDWETEALKQRNVIKGYRAKAAKSDKLQIKWDSIELVEGVPLPVSAAEKEQELRQGENDKAREILKQLLTFLAGGSAFQGAAYDLTPLGKKTAIAYLSPLKSAGIVPHGRIPELTYDDITKAVDAIYEKVEGDENLKQSVSDLRDELAKVGLGLDDAKDSQESF